MPPVIHVARAARLRRRMERADLVGRQRTLEELHVGQQPRRLVPPRCAVTVSSQPPQWECRLHADLHAAPVQPWQGWAQSRCRCGRGEPGPA